MASFRDFLKKAKNKWDKLNSEEEKLKRMARQATKEENRLEREERLAWVKQEKYKLKKQVEDAKLAYIKAKHARERAEKETSGGSFLSRAGASLDKLLSGGSKKKSGQGTGRSKNRDSWNFWD